MTTSYLTLSTLKLSSNAADEALDECEARYPGYIAQQIAIASAKIDTRLRKRYAAPFDAPYPITVVEWCAAIVTERAMRKRGIDPTDEQAATYIADRTTAEAELLEAANAEVGLFDLPLRSDTTATGIVSPEPLASSQASAYVWMDEQAEQAGNEDSEGHSTPL